MTSTNWRYIWGVLLALFIGAGAIYLSEPRRTLPAPVLETLMVSPTGEMVLAGRAEPGATLNVMVGDRNVASGTADEAGAFSFVAEVLPASVPRPMVIEASQDGWRPGSSDPVDIAPFVFPEEASEPAAKPEDEVTTADDAGPSITTEDALTAQPEVANAAEAEEVTIAPPTLDHIQLSPDGILVLAGRADPNTLIEVRIAGNVAERYTSDSRGQFAPILLLEPSADIRPISLIADPEGAAVASTESYFVEPFGLTDDAPSQEGPVVVGAIAPVAEEELAALATDDEPAAEAALPLTETDAPAATATEEIESEEAPVQTAAADPDDLAPAEQSEDQVKDVVVAQTATDGVSAPSQTAEVVAPSEEAPQANDVVTEVTDAIEEIFGDQIPGSEAQQGVEEAEASQVMAELPATTGSLTQQQPQPRPNVLVANEDGVRVVGAGPQALSQVALDSITYDPEGEVQLAGRATSDGFVQVYIDNKPVTSSRISEGRNWRTDLPEIDTGIYTLRIDEVDSDGNVVSRIETPFKREEPETVVAAMAEETAQADFDVAVKTVQPGATLWAIAREQYGEGILYVAVFEANADQIRNPDLIYPGQIFVLPELEENAGASGN